MSWLIRETAFLVTVKIALEAFSCRIQRPLLSESDGAAFHVVVYAEFQALISNSASGLRYQGIRNQCNGTGR